MIDDKKDLKFNKSSEEELELNYEDTSSVKDVDNNGVNTGSHQDFFEPLNEETYAEDTVTKEEVEEIADEKKSEEAEGVVEAEKIEEVLEVVEEIEEAEELEESEVIEAEEVEEMKEILEDEEISVESEDEVVEVNDEFPSSASGLETDMTPTSDESTEPPSLDMEDGYEVDTELDKYGNVVEVFASVNGRNIGISPLTLNDERLPSEVKKPSGTVSHFGETKGGVALSIVSGKDTVEKGKFEFQGTAKASLVFTGGILNSKIEVGQVKLENGIITDDSATASVTRTMREFLVNAANETIDDINGVKYSALISAIDDRAYLVLALSTVLAANDSHTKNKNTPLKLTFRDLDSISPRQVTLDFKANAIFTTSIDNVKNIINEKSFVNNLSDISKGIKSNASNVNLNPEGIAVNIDFKSEKLEEGLKTNSRYEFIGPNKDMVFFIDFNSTLTSDTANVNYLEGLTMTQFKTAKQLPLFEAYQVKQSTTPIGDTDIISTIAMFSVISDGDRSKYLNSSVDFNSINDVAFVDYNNMVSTNAISMALDIRGTSIKFKTFKIFDKDSTITKMEIEDDRMNRYPVSLAPIDANNIEKGAYPQVTSLQRSTPYTFRKLYVTASPENESVTKSFNLVTLEGFTGTGTSVTAIAHNVSIRTSTFTEPKLFIELDEQKKYVKVDSGEYKNTSGSSHVEVFVPKSEIELPNKVKMPVVTNDKDSLRYVIEVENTDATIKDLTVNGLKGDEKYKIERVDGKDKVYFILTLFNLSENRDYGFIILELSYTDIDGRDLITRQVLSGINVITNVNITTSGKDFPITGIVQVPDQTLDNTTGPELMGNAIFNVTLFEATTLEARKAEIPIFMDDMNGRFLRMEFKKPEANPAVEVKLDGSLLKFTNLEPKSEVVYKLDFVWKDKDNKEQILSKYAKISTPAVPAVDVKSTTITTTSSTAEIVFELFSAPKSSISGVTLSDDKIKFTWNRDKLTLNLEGLKPSTEYKDLEITFKLENGLISKYKIETFKTKEEVKPPTGNVAEFVARIYEAALGRKPEFVARIYEAALGRKPEVEGWKFWVQKLESKELSVTQFVYDLIAQDEFVNRFLSKEDFIKMMYIIVVGRDPEEEGQKYWERKYDEYKLQESSLAELRRRIATEMMSEPEFKDYVTKIGLKY